MATFNGNESDNVLTVDGSTFFIPNILLSNTLNGFGGDDVLVGGLVDDVLNGGDGDDVLDGLAGGDELNGGADVDTVSYALSLDGVTVDLDNNTASGGNAEGDSFSSIENVIGSLLGDDIRGDNGKNELYGLSGDDDLFGGRGRDYLDGGSGDDDLDGGRGKDTLLDGFGADTLTGGDNADAFIISLDFNENVITDFTIGEDSLAVDRVIEVDGGPNPFTLIPSNGLRDRVYLEGQEVEVPPTNGTVTVDINENGDTEVFYEEPISILDKELGTEFTTIILEGVNLVEEGGFTNVEILNSWSNGWSNGDGGSIGTIGGFTGKVEIKNVTGEDQTIFDFDLDFGDFTFVDTWMNGVNNPLDFNKTEGEVTALETGNPYWQPVFADDDTIEVFFNVQTSDEDALAALLEGGEALEEFVNDDASLNFIWGDTFA